MKENEKDMRIVVLQRGWVYVGEYHQDGSKCWLENAKNIRRWGTTKGLGEIAKDGPTKETVLDPGGVVRFHELTVVFTKDCVGEAWKKHL